MMITQLIRFAVLKRTLVITVLISLLALCAYFIPRVNLDAFPDVTNVQVSINTQAPGLAAQEIEQLISYPIETLMYALPDVESVRSISKTGLSGVTIVFKEHVDIYFARQLVLERLTQAQSLLPSDIEPPSIGPNTSGLGQIYQYQLQKSKESPLNNRDLRSLNDWVVKLLLMPVDGITEILSFGGEVKQFNVALRPDRLQAYNVKPALVIEAIEANNTNAGGWYLARAESQLAIRGVGWFNYDDAISQLAQTPVKSYEGKVIRIRDVAHVSLQSEERLGAVTLSVKDESGNIQSQGEVVTGIVLKRIGANTNETINAINQRIALINQALPDGVTFKILYDQADLVKQAINTVVYALLFAFLLIICVIALFMLSLRATVLVLISIPISIALALGFMAFFGLSANLMSLGGLAIAIGMLVDGSVVMVENIVNTPSDPQHSRPMQIINAALQVAKPVCFASTIILVLYLPLFSFTGVEAKLFEPMATTMMIAVFCALLVALLIVPALASVVFNRPIKLKRNRLLEQMKMYYKHALRFAVKQQLAILIILCCLIGVTLAVIPKLGSEFVPELEEGTLNVRVTLAPSSNLNTALSIAPKLERLLLEFEQVTYALSRIGRAEIGGDPEPVNNIEIYLGLTPQNTWPEGLSRQTLQTKMAEKLEQFPGILLTFSQPIATRVDELLSGVKSQLAVKIMGPDLSQLQTIGDTLATAIASIPGTADVAAEQLSGEAQLLISPKREMLSRHGLAVRDIMDLVSVGLGGLNAGQIVHGNARYAIHVRLSEQARNSKQAIEQLPIQTPNGYWLSLSDVARVDYAQGPNQIRRDDVQRRIVIQVNVSGRDMGSIVNDITRTIEQSSLLPKGYTFDIGGQFENQLRSQKTLGFIIPLSLGLISLLLYFVFRSLTQTALILVNVPLAAIGGVLSMFVFEQNLSVPTFIGFITLFGIAVLNGVVLIDSINQRLPINQEPITAIIDGAASRFAPVLMTALTSALGLIPMLTSTGVGAEIQKPLASVIVGGIFTSTLLTLIVLPVLYCRFSLKHATTSVEPSNL
ncbi:Cobalt-zinc-cadmium resistance protein CzcA; Cation efflux system protein CusA [Pseudoalteromonas luteoviolacea B = ATCC 29581]|nr:Cobalt-zinc-cadmium resistance protein CzcA; Cation efflux system protein CusA [Pseudoalteromonas luteoviolacea B = ATCC 29581]